MTRNLSIFWATALACSLIFTGCGGSDSASYKSEDNYATADGGAYEESYDTSLDEEVYEPSEAAESDSGSEGSTLDIEEHNPDVTAKKIDTEKLIYTCNLSIDTLEFEESTKTLSSLIAKYDGFIESEEYSDGGSYDYYSYYYIEDTSKHDSYKATIRIPSSSYDAFVEDAATLGDVRSRNSNVENVSQEYSDLGVSLEIYEAAYDRYMKLLSDAADEDYALKLQQKITDTQIEIARIKTRMGKIDTDVSYSFVNIYIKEVSKYDAKPLPQDTFTQRLVSEISDTAQGFLDFLEGLLFTIIHLLPYAALIGIICAIVAFIRKKMGKRPLRELWRERRQRKREEKLMNQRYKGATPPPAPLVRPTPDTPPDESKPEEAKD